MTWWTWGLIAWSLLASVGVLWLAAMCDHRRRRDRRGRPAGERVPAPDPAAQRVPSVPGPRVGTFPPAAHPAVPAARPAPDAVGMPAVGRQSDDRPSALQRLLDGALAGHYTLPEPLLRAVEGYDRLRRLEIGEPAGFRRSDAAGELVTAAAAHAPLEPVALSARIHRSRSDLLLATEAREVVALAVEQARTTAVGTAGQLSGRIVDEHLRPAHREVLRQARSVASRLERYTDDDFSVDPQRIVSAGRRVRSAFALLPALVRRHRSLLEARSAVDVLAGHGPQHDSRDLFAILEDPPLPGLAGLPVDRTPEVPLPDDDMARLLWLVSDRAATATRLR